MKNNKTKYVILFYDILVKSYWNENTDDLEFIRVSVVDRHYEEYSNIKSVINRSRKFKNYEQAVNKHCSGWCVYKIVDTHGKEVILPKKEISKRYYSPAKRHSKYFKHIRYRSWNEECSNASDLKRNLHENYGLNVKVRNHPLDNWEISRSNHCKGWKSRKIRKQYEKNIRKVKNDYFKFTGG